MSSRPPYMTQRESTAAADRCVHGSGPESGRPIGAEFGDSVVRQLRPLRVAERWHGRVHEPAAVVDVIRIDWATSQSAPTRTSDSSPLRWTIGGLSRNSLRTSQSELPRRDASLMKPQDTSAAYRPGIKAVGDTCITPRVSTADRSR